MSSQIGTLPPGSVHLPVYSIPLHTRAGLLGVFCRTLLDSLERLPGDARTMVGILTFDSTLHFYNLKVCTCTVTVWGALDIVACSNH